MIVFCNLNVLVVFVGCVRRGAVELHWRGVEYSWLDDKGEEHFAEQSKGGEQADPLMPPLFPLGTHPALERAQAQLQEGERVFVFLTTFRPSHSRTASAPSMTSLLRQWATSLEFHSMKARPVCGTEQGRVQLAYRNCVGKSGAPRGSGFSAR